MDNPISPPIQTRVDPVDDVYIAQPQEMSFPDAVRELIKGKRISRLEWNNTDYGFLSEDGWLSIYKNGEKFVWKVNDGDLKALDWIVLNG